MKVLVIGSGPQVEGQVGALAVRALIEHGHEVVLLEPSPTSPAEAHRTYLEPLTAEAAQRIIAAEKPDALLAGFGRAATELALQLKGALGGVKWLGPSAEVLALTPPAEADVVVEVAGDVALGQVELNGNTWVCPASVHRPQLDAAATQELKAKRFTGCARVFFQGGVLKGIDPVVGAASAFTSRALGVNIPRLAVRLALGLPVDEKPTAGVTAVRRTTGGVEMMSRISEATAPVAPGKSVVVLGAAGVEKALQAEGAPAVVVDADPSALSGSATRYYEPYELEAVLGVCKREQPRGVIVQLGGRAALALAPALEAAGVKVLGTSGANLQKALDREAFAGVVAKAGLQQPASAVATSWEQTVTLAGRIGYPLLARTGTGLTYVSDEKALKAVFQPGVLLQAFLAEATQASVELLRDATGKVVVCGVVENVEQAGVHAADAACTLPPHSLKSELQEKLKDAAQAIAEGLNVIGLLEVNFALQGKAVWVLEANPRASRTLPFVAKATGLDLASLAARLMLGKSLEEVGLKEDPVLKGCAVRESVFDENVELGPTQRSTGTVMAIAESLPVAFGKSQLAAGTALPTGGTAFISVPDDDKPAVVDLAQRLLALGFALTATRGTQAYLARKGVSAALVKKVRDGSPHVGEAIANKAITLVICAVGPEAYEDCAEIRRAARVANVPNFTTVEAARMAVGALEAQAAGARVIPLQAFARAPSV